MLSRSAQSRRGMLLAVVLVTSVCGLLYEMIIGTMMSDGFGGGSAQYSFIIGLYLFAMGLGAALSRRVHGNELNLLVQVEIFVALLGGSSAAILQAAHDALGPQSSVVVVVLTLLIGAGVGLEIPLLTRIAAAHGGLEKALADVLSFDYLGALIASLVFPFILLPRLGIIQTAMLIGLANIGAAGLTTWLGYLQRRSICAVLGISLLLLVGGMALV
jgi:spermidine synthase